MKRKRIICAVLIAAICNAFSACSFDFLPEGLGGLGQSSTGTESSSGPIADSGNGDTSDKQEPSEVVSDSLTIHFLELGNQYTGDCTLIQVGNTEVLIDAGSRKNSAARLVEYIDEYCEDGVLEYVIATHADQDHIAGFVGNKDGNSRTGILYEYDIGTLIQFPLTGKEEFTAKGNRTMYGEYLQAVEYVEGKGTAVYTALQCWNNADGAARTYELGEGVTMTFLYQKYYETATSDENDYSVCMLLTQTQWDKHYLFTGDLEKHGEASLVEKNELPQCVLYKGGHHGSPTSSTETLLSVIRPEIVCVCCCSGSSEYTQVKANQFPSQAFIDRIAPYTDKVYVTTVISADGKRGESLNGDIRLLCADGRVDVDCSANNLLLKETEWFLANRTMPNAWK